MLFVEVLLLFLVIIICSFNFSSPVCKFDLHFFKSCCCVTKICVTFIQVPADPVENYLFLSLKLFQRQTNVRLIDFFFFQSHLMNPGVTGPVLEWSEDELVQEVVMVSNCRMLSCHL